MRRYPFRTLHLILFTLLKGLGINNAHICGLSMGGMVAQEIYRQAPEMCRSLILVSTLHFAPKHLGKFLLTFKEYGIEKLSIKEEKDIAARVCLYSWSEKNLKLSINFINPTVNFIFHP